jgi:hypothetical protein
MTAKRVVLPATSSMFSARMSRPWWTPAWRLAMAAALGVWRRSRRRPLVLVTSTSRGVREVTGEPVATLRECLRSAVRTVSTIGPVAGGQEVVVDPQRHLRQIPPAAARSRRGVSAIRPSVEFSSGATP